jgi:hypothetical protein
MTFTGEQINRIGDAPSRLFFIDARMRGLPVDVFHAFVNGSATMRAKACSAVKVVDASGPEMTRAETVTLLNDLCIFAAAGLVDPAIRWDAVDDRSARATFTSGSNTVQATLVFNDAGELVDFVSDDRLASSPDGKQFTPRRWSTPVGAYRAFGPRRLSTRGEARWHAPAPDGEFAYLTIELQDIAYNVRTR